jgi:FtsZ-interacting cell division protein ZipA
MIPCRNTALLSASVMLAGLMLVALPVPAAKPGVPGKPGATMHKCTDAKGRIYYTDSPGPDCADGVELNRQGVKVDRPKPAPTPGVAANAKTETPQSVEQTRRDKAILATYTAESQIEEAKARNLEPPVQAVKLAEKHVERARSQLAALSKQAEQLTRQNKPVPATLTEDLRLKEADVARLESELVRKKAAADQVAARFEADRQRFRELKGLEAPR